MLLLASVAALKCCLKDRIHKLEQRHHVLNEKACMQRLATLQNPHPFVNTLVQTFKQRDKLFFLLEFVQVDSRRCILLRLRSHRNTCCVLSVSCGDCDQGGELFTLLKKRIRFSDSEARFYTANVVLFLQTAHARSVVYRDIKPENMLLDELGYVVVADFGFAKQLKRHSSRTYTLCG